MFALFPILHNQMKGIKNNYINKTMHVDVYRKPPKQYALSPDTYLLHINI